MNEVETITLENNQEYIIINCKQINNQKYVYLININNNKDFIIRKKEANNLIGLATTEEYNLALTYLFE